jgi:hypothetical protein
MMQKMRRNHFLISIVVSIAAFLVLDRILFPFVPMSENSWSGLFKFTLVLCILSAGYKMLELYKEKRSTRK